MGEINSYKDLLIWQKGMQIVRNVYSLTKEFPQEELYALTSQLKRSAVSIPSNIAEGYGRQSTASYKNFIKISRGSLFELETQLILAESLDFTQNKKLLAEVLELINEEGKMINAFLKKLD